MTTVSKARRLLAGGSFQGLRSWVAERTDLKLIHGGDEELRKLCFVDETSFVGIGFDLRENLVMGRPSIVAVNLRTDSIVMLPPGRSGLGVDRTSRHGAEWLEAAGLTEGTWHWFERGADGVESGPFDEDWHDAAEAALRVGFLGACEPIVVEGKTMRLSDHEGAVGGRMLSMFDEVREVLQPSSQRDPKVVFVRFVEVVASGIEGLNQDLKVDERRLAGGDVTKLCSAKALSACVRHLRIARDAFADGEVSEASASVDFFVERLVDVAKDPVVREWISDELAELAESEAS